MRCNQIKLVLALLLFLVPSVLAAETRKLQSETDRINYSVGYQIGGDFLRQGVGMNGEVLLQGIRDAMEHKTPLLSAQEMTTTLVDLKKKIVADERIKLDQQLDDFLGENRKKEGVVELSSGVQYRILQAGSGPKPTMQDAVKIKFRAKTTDGTVVSDTFKANGPKTYSMAKVLPALQAVLPMMQEGSRWEVVVPKGPEGRGRNESIEARGILLYEIELLAVIPAETPKN